MLACLTGFTQSLQPSVFNSSGGAYTVPSGTTTVEVFYNIGEPVVEVISNASANMMLTQGFLQPDIIGKIGLSFTAMVSNESCLQRADGKIVLEPNTLPVGTDHKLFYWTPAAVCPTNDCENLDSLSPGTYSVLVIAYDASNNVLDSLNHSYTITASTEPCQISTYSGFTPNGDGKNDTWYIENIENFSSNRVYIYNRWGNKLWETNGYNNQTNCWKGENQKTGGMLPTGTYFYIIELNNGNGVKKGWVELTTN
ncbi:MAG: gliding motility-associated C-terminal domain-containing protein [Bacteroidetes bacterium]|nr:gliding motility-associated C-terminal domain-containing protein [Bacteroidota bacterium]